jgi:nicotinamidase/pyrazinamidase
MKALLLVDIQNDFLPGGALAVPASDEVIAVANRLMPEYELVVATQDWHPANHESFASQHEGRNIGEIKKLHGLEQILWPEHCVQGSPGAELAAELDYESIHHIVKKGTDPTVDSYSAFFDNARRKSTGLAEFLRAKRVDEIHVLGLATDYCVRATVLDGLDLGFRIVLLTEGIRGVDLTNGDCDRAIEEMRGAGAIIK